MNNTLFELQLEALIGRPSTLRPFICDGSPLECPVFFVGTNATTELDFWSFWNSQTGFDKRRWEQAYGEHRRRQGKRKQSNTRAMLGWILDGLPGVKALETNISPVPTSRASELEAHHRTPSVLEFLIKAVKPKIILAHGEEAVAAINPLLTSAGHTAIVLPSKHLRFWSRERANEISTDIQRALC